MTQQGSKKNKKTVHNKNWFVVTILLFVIIVIAIIFKQNKEGKNNYNIDASLSNLEKYETTINKVAVAYFSATGNTKAVAEKIANMFNCDIITIDPVEPYSHEDLTSYDPNTRPQRESRYNPFETPVELEENEENIDDGEIKSLPKIKKVKLSEYSTIFLGYPIWFGDAPRVIYTFIKENNFKNIVIIPFCTSDNDDISPSDQNLAKFASDSVKFTIGKKFKKDSTEEEIIEFIKTIGFDIDGLKHK